MYYKQDMYFEGISNPAYSKEMLVEYSSHVVQYNGKTLTDYEASQKQRTLERAVKKQKQKLVCTETVIKSIDDDVIKAELKADFDRQAVKLKERESKLDDFCKQTGRKIDSHRVQVYGFDRSVSSKAVWGNKRVANSKKSGIIKYIELPAEINDVKGINAEISKAISDAIDKYKKNYSIDIHKINVVSFGKGNETKPFRFNPQKIGNWYSADFEINKDYYFNDSLEEYQKRIMRNYNNGILASKSIEDLIGHEMAHFMSFADCQTWEQFSELEIELSGKFVSGISKYADATRDGIECIAEAFIRLKNNEEVPDEVKKLIKKYIERWENK